MCTAVVLRPFIIVIIERAQIVRFRMLTDFVLFLSLSRSKFIHFFSMRFQFKSKSTWNYLFYFYFICWLYNLKDWQQQCKGVTFVWIVKRPLCFCLYRLAAFFTNHLIDSIDLCHTFFCVDFVSG